MSLTYFVQKNIHVTNLIYNFSSMKTVRRNDHLGNLSSALPGFCCLRAKFRFSRKITILFNEKRDESVTGIFALDSVAYLTSRQFLFRRVSHVTRRNEESKLRSDWLICDHVRQRLYDCIMRRTFSRKSLT